ncbi:carbohydrate ABC transporter permease [Paenibacillus senegalensis]|uniref:carbohydrate ABC transporter permease n=1 Tax=Paenibacillus senegalensis TaxID=1465766 RepID=UPI00028919ED|nr:carbohydrate ABC transporter permease [Paenibacillus senegalensis]
MKAVFAQPDNLALSHKKNALGTKAAIGLVALLLIGYFLIVAYPLFWMLMSSFKKTEEIYSSTWSLPHEWMFSNYAKAWEMGVSQYFLNSVIVSTVAVIITVLVSAFSAYGLSRFSFKGKYLILGLLSAGLMFSPQVSLIPLYKLVQNLGIHDTHWALILPYVAFRISMTVLLIRSFFLKIPKELEESAYLEGCSSLGIFFRIFVPLSKPIIWTTVLLTAYWTWNEFLFAIIFIDSNSMKTITSGLLAFRDALYTDWGVLMAGLVISALPLVLLFIFMQKHFVRGLAEGGVKG